MKIDGFMFFYAEPGTKCDDCNGEPGTYDTDWCELKRDGERSVLCDTCADAVLKEQ